MSHIQDVWMSLGPDGTDHPTPRYGHGKRWKARWHDHEGCERSKNFALRKDASQFLVLKDKELVSAELFATDSRGIDGGIDPVGYYVYLLWETRGGGKPVYVGKSANILNRLGAHLGDSSKRSRIRWVTFIRCASEEAMRHREAQLIRKYRPEWNKSIPLEDGTVLLVDTPARSDRQWQRLTGAVRARQRVLAMQAVENARKDGAA
jgi:hypothetical protein